jgi:hypothetical protein
MELEIAIEGVQNWLRLLQQKNTEAINNILKQGNHFVFTYQFDIEVDGEYSKFLHAYPGIYNGRLYFFIVPSNCDTPEGLQLPQSIEQTVVLPSGDNGGIEPEEAALRISNWQNYYPMWVNQHIDSEFGVFQAFAIPTSDLKAPMGTSYSYTGYLALAENPDDLTNMPYRADIVISEVTPAGAEVFFDTVRPVPPYSPSYSAYYLLTLSQP